MLFLRLWHHRSICDLKHRLQLSRRLRMIRFMLHVARKKKHLIVNQERAESYATSGPLRLCAAQRSVSDIRIYWKSLCFYKRKHKKSVPTTYTNCFLWGNSEHITRNGSWKNSEQHDKDGRDGVCGETDQSGVIKPTVGQSESFSHSTLYLCCCRSVQNHLKCVYRPVSPVWWANATCTWLHFKQV